MVVTLKNIGTLHEASFDLDKDLIVFIGPNNTGKTYASYCLYGLDLHDQPPELRLPSDISSQIIPDLVELFATGEIVLVKESILNETNLALLYQYWGDEFKKRLPNLFNLNENDFLNSEISFQLPNYDIKTEFKSAWLVSDINIEVRENNVKVRINKKVLENLLQIESNQAKVKSLIIHFIFEQHVYFGHYYFIPAERIGISIFARDIFRNRFTKTNEILKDAKLNGTEKVDMMLKEFNTYSTIIQDSLEQYSDLTRTSTTFFSDPEIRKLADELEAKILKGKIATNSEGEVFFNTSDKKEIKIQASGSIIKSLAMLVLYLRYTAQPKQTVIIDEPEINLHPDNQRLVARILAKLSKLGVKVIVSTHSDYFIRELNNLIMLNKDHPETLALREKYGYEETEVLEHTRVGAYLFKNHIATPIEVTAAGMEAATIDEEINKLNNTATDIYWTLFED